MPYISKNNETIKVDVVILEKEAKSSLILSSLQICLDIQIVRKFCVTFVEPSKSWFTVNPGLLNIDHICHYDCTLISINNDFGLVL